MYIHLFVCVSVLLSSAFYRVACLALFADRKQPGDGGLPGLLHPVVFCVCCVHPNAKEMRTECWFGSYLIQLR